MELSLKIVNQIIELLGNLCYFCLLSQKKKEELLYNIKRIFKKTKQRIILSMQIISER